MILSNSNFFELASEMPSIFTDWLANGILNVSGWTMFAYLMVVTHITIASVTIFLHRCQAHRSLDLHPIPSHFFRFWLWLTTGMVTKEWAAIHRKHHAKCETAEDPHSPQVLGLHCVFWRGADLYKIESKNQETVTKYGHGTPEDWIEKNVYSKYQWQGVASMMVIDLLLFGAFGGLIWAIQMMWIPVTAAGVINGIGHYFGYRNYDCEDASRNIVPFGILIGGEELHNNHHTFATSAKLSSKWYEFDIGWFYIQILEKCNLAKVKKSIPKIKTQDAQIPNAELLASVIHHRYEVMARYTLTLRKAFAEEVEGVKVLAKDFSDNHLWLYKDEEKLTSLEKCRLESLIISNEHIATLVHMRRELVQLWARTHHSKEHLVEQLHTWCKKAEHSKSEYLRNFSMNLRAIA
jgi:stearoyl-CoA desaturase (delta-9 desaturase)